jgi:hypothetical protein
MKRVARFSFVVSLSVATIAMAAILSGCGGGASSMAPFQSANNPLPQSGDIITLTNAEVAATHTYTDFRYHINPIVQPGKVNTMSVVFPLDMKNGGGAVLKATTENDIYVNTTAAAVGSPATFQANLNLNSTFFGVLNQYNGVTSTGKFPVGTAFTSTVATYSNMISQDTLFAVIHAAAKTGGTGYGHEYNVFLASGLDTCFDFGPCYSPDNPPTWVFCAYHGSITFTDIGHVVYSIMPYQYVGNAAGACGDFGLSTPNTEPIDSTATTLWHETAESISDADPNSAWFNTTFNMEIADVCNNIRATETLNAHAYLIQPVYSNLVHGCFF